MSDPQSGKIDPLVVELRALEVFVAVVESGGMSGAAKRLNVSQSAVSQQIVSLERALGAVLLDRRTRPPAPTVQGRALMEHASALLHDARELNQVVREAGRNKLPHLRIAMIDSVASTLAPDVFQLLGSEVGNCAVWSGLSVQHGLSLLQREVDLIVSLDALEDVDRLERHFLLSEPYVVAVSASEPPAASLSELSRRSQLIRYSARSQTGQEIERHVRWLRLHAPRRLEFDNTDSVLAMVAAGLGWAITTPLCTLQASRHLSLIRILPIVHPGMLRRLTVVARDGELGKFPTRLVVALRDSARRRLIAHVQAQAPWLASAIEIGPIDD